jgi:broad specificity phosphatase PhoE
MKIYLARHPETIGNQQQLIYGKTHYAYTENGQAQLETLVNTVVGLSMDRIYASPLERITKITDVIAKEVEVPITFDQRLEEMNFGIFEGLTVEEVKEKYLDIYEKYLDAYDKFAIPEGENFLDFRCRVLAFVKEILMTEDQTVLILTHGRVIKEIIEYLLDLKDGQGWCIQVQPGAVALIEYKDDFGQLIIENLVNGSVNHEREFVLELAE